MLIGTAFLSLSCILHPPARSQVLAVWASLIWVGLVPPSILLDLELKFYFSLCSALENLAWLLPDLLTVSDTYCHLNSISKDKAFSDHYFTGCFLILIHNCQWQVSELSMSLLRVSLNFLDHFLNHFFPVLFSITSLPALLAFFLSIWDWDIRVDFILSVHTLGTYKDIKPTGYIRYLRNQLKQL